MTEFFQFEADFVASLRCIPMQVRLKLDTCGIKLKLVQWNRFSQEDREKLVQMACNSGSEAQEYRSFLHQLILERTGTEATDLAIDSTPAWRNMATIPTSVLEKTEELGVSLTPEQWANLTPLQRFALIKLSRSGHENSNFLPALKEFHLY